MSSAGTSYINYWHSHTTDYSAANKNDNYKDDGKYLWYNSMHIKKSSKIVSNKVIIST